MRLSILPFLLLIIPITEIGVFIAIGQQIGVAWTLALIVATAITGTVLLRIQGFAIVARIKAAIDAGRLPGDDLASGAMILVAGILLLTPGFVTDSVGFTLFIPAVRRAIWGFLRRNLTIVTRQNATAARTEPPEKQPAATVIDLEEGDYDETPNPNSPWRN